MGSREIQNISKEITRCFRIQKDLQEEHKKLEQIIDYDIENKY